MGKNMREYLCKKIGFCFEDSKFSIFLILITLFLQTYMIIRALAIMAEIQSINYSMQSDYYRLKKIRYIADEFVNAHIAISQNKKNAYCLAINSALFNINSDEQIKNNIANISRKDKLINFLEKEILYCRSSKQNLKSKLDDIVFYLQAVRDYSGIFSYTKFTANGKHITEKINGIIKNLVYVSALISCFVYALIVVILVYAKKINKQINKNFQDIIKLKNGIDNTPLPTLITDADGKIEYVNCAFCETYGYSREEVIGANPRVIKSKTISKNVYENLWKTIKSGNKWVGQFKNLSKSGEEIIVQAYITPIKDISGKIVNFIGIHKDITVQQRLIKMLAEARREAELANQAKSDFLSSMSHEIRTPLNAIVGMSDLLDEAQLSLEHKRYLEILRSASESLLSLVNDILDVSKIEAGKVELEKTDLLLDEIAYKVAEIISVKASQRNIEVSCRIAPDTPVKLLGDPVRLRQVLINLMGNSVKFVEKGWIALEIKKQKEENGIVYIAFSVKDTGIGIPEDKIEKIFDKFSQAETSTLRKYGGTGLGLPISKMLIELMGGNISVKSKVGEGSEFSFVLPFEISKAKVTSFVESARLDELKGVKVLVADDNPVNRIIVKEIMTSNGAIALDVDSGEKAIEMLRENDLKAPFKILFLDFNMPQMNGFETAKKIMEDPSITKKPAIIPFTSDNIKMNKDAFIKIGIDHFMVKPVKKNELLHSALDVLGKKVFSKEKEEKKEIVYSKQELPSIRILIVDDNEDNRTLMRSFLKDSEVKAEFAEDGIEALEKFKDGIYDAVFMDMQMPRLDGTGAMLKIREMELPLGRKTKVVALTAMALKEEVEKAIKAGFDDYLTKPIRKNAFYAYLINLKK